MKKIVKFASATVLAIVVSTSVFTIKEQKFVGTSIEGVLNKYEKVIGEMNAYESMIAAGGTPEGVIRNSYVRREDGVKFIGDQFMNNGITVNNEEWEESSQTYFIFIIDQNNNEVMLRYRWVEDASDKHRVQVMCPEVNGELKEDYTNEYLVYNKLWRIY